MTESGTNLYRQQKNPEDKQRGTRCHICIGCGRCFAGGEGIRILTSWEEASKDSRGQQQYRGISDESPMPETVRKFFGDDVQEESKDSWLIAADIGTTTIAMVLYDSEGQEREKFAVINPQTQYGADVLSRIQAAQEPEVAACMQESVVQVLEEGIQRFTQNITSPLRMVIAANTTMVYLLMGWNTAELGRAPFQASHLEKVSVVLGGVPTVILPGLSAFVGADIMAGIYACGMAEAEEITLLIDLGTNGEMVLGNRERMIACATAAGPAFEGGATRGIWGADMVSLTARLRTEGIFDETGLLTEEYFDEGIRIGDVLITQQAVREIQLAKGAIAAGIRILAKQYGLQEMGEVKRVVLAGGFGYFLNGEDAAEIGLLPQELVSKVWTAGNTALLGAKLLGQGGDSKEVMLDRIGRITRILNLAEQPEFENIYLEAMNLEKW